MSTMQKNPKTVVAQDGSTIDRHEQLILDTSSIGVLITRISDGTILYANKAIANLLGIPDIGPVIGSPVPNFYWDPEERLSVIKRFRAEGSISQYPLRTRRADDSMLWVTISIQPFSFEGEQVLLTEIVDISERKQAEEALYASEANLSALFDSNPTGMVLIERENRTIVKANAAAAKLIGVSKEEVVGRICHGFMCPAESNRCPICDLGQTVDRSERMLIKADGSQMPILKTVVQIKLDGKDHLLESFIDNTERKQAETALHASEERFRRFTEVTVEALVFHEQGRIVDANPAGLAMFGMSENSDIVGRNLMEFIVPDSHKLVLQQMQLESVKPYEIQCIRNDGTTFPVETSTRTYKVGEQTIRASSIRDITERKQVEQNLQLQSAALESAANSIVITDRQGSIIWVNPAFTRTTGFTAEEVIGKNPRAVKSGKHTKEFYREMWETILAGKVWHGEIINRRKDGSNYSEEMSITPVRNEHGEITHFAAIKQDISERKRAEEALRDSQQLLQTVMDNIPLSVFWKDTQLNFIGCNQAFAADIGMTSPIDVIGKSDFDMPSSDRAELYRADDSLVIQSGTPKINYEEPQTTPDGSTNWLRTSKIPMRDADGKIFAMLGMYEDITEQKTLQQKVQDLFERRGYQVQVSTEISQEVAAATELNELFKRVVTLTKERLGYYHTQLLRYDLTQDAVVLINGYGETGHKMLEGGHKMPMGSGLIGTAAESGQTVLRPTLADDPDWHPNPLLPETKGEIAVPIKWQDNVLGVLDVQSDQAGALTEDDRLLLEGLCGQIAIAMQSAELVEAVRQNEARLAEALKTARLANWEYDVEKDIFTFNDQFYSIFHITAEKVGGYQLSSARYAELFVYPDDMDMVGTEIGKALSSTERVYNTTLDHRILYADGGIGYITVKLTVERDENGKITRYYGANQDITERKQAEEALRRNEQEMADRLEEVNRLYLSMSQEGWKSYRETADLPAGFMYDQAGLRASDEEVLADELFANIPMRVPGGEVVGTLTVANDPRNPTSDEDHVFLQQVSDQIALAMESARLAAQTQTALAQTEKLSEAGLRFAQSTSLQELLVVANETLGIPVVNRSLLGVFNYNSANDMEDLVIVANWWNGSGHEPSEIGRRYTLETLNALPFLMSSTPVFSNDTFDDERITGASLQLVKQQNIRSMAVLPLYLGSQQIGVVFLESEETYSFSQPDIRLFTAMAPQIATVLENRRQFERAQKQAERESTLNVISQKIQSATTVEAVLQIAARELGHALGAPMTIAQLSMKDKN